MDSPLNANSIQQDSPNNLVRLKSHLKKDSLAEKLVAARIGVAEADSLPAVRKVMLDRLEELRRIHESVQNP